MQNVPESHDSATKPYRGSLIENELESSYAVVGIPDKANIGCGGCGSTKTKTIVNRSWINQS